MAGFHSRFVCLLAPVVAALSILAAGCGASGGHRAATATTTAEAQRSSAPCKLNRAQRRAVARASADIRRLRRIQEPLHTYSQQGTPAQQAVTGKFLLDLGSAKLPVDLRAHLLHLAKASVGLCGSCFQGLESMEPVLATRLGEKRCG